MKGLLYPEGCSSLTVPATRNYGWWEQGAGDEGAQGSLLEPVSVHAGHCPVVLRGQRKENIEGNVSTRMC